MSFLRNVTRAGDDEGRLFPQANTTFGESRQLLKSLAIDQDFHSTDGVFLKIVFVFFIFSDSYAKVTFSIGNKIIKTKKSTVHHTTRDPLYNESFNFTVSGDDLGSGTLLVSIMHSRGGGKEDQLIGRVLLGGMMYARGTECEHWTEMMTNPRNMIKYWHTLTG